MPGGVRIRSLMMVAAGLFLASSVLGQSSEAVPASASPTSSNPRVSYTNGKLAINAQNTTMKDLLRAVSLATGAVIEFPNDHAADRMSATIAPGPVRDVLTTLLNGSGFNYVMLGSPSDPRALQRMILTDAEPSAQPQLAQADEVAPPAVAANQPARNAFLYQPPAAPSVPLTREVPIIPLEAPKDSVAPEALGQMMRDLADQIRQKQQEQGLVPAPVQQNFAAPQPSTPPPQNIPPPQPDTASAPE
ncbi:MAG: hypothetical protein WB523_04855 [Candidatus Sulfotelmatobacter sp.]